MNVLSVALDNIGRAATKLDKVAARIANSPASDTVDLSKEAVNLIQARNEFETGIKVAQTGDEMTRATLEIFG